MQGIERKTNDSHEKSKKSTGSKENVAKAMIEIVHVPAIEMMNQVDIEAMRGEICSTGSLYGRPSDEMVTRA